MMWKIGVVIGLSKIMIMKAIHNSNVDLLKMQYVVIGLSKIMIMKAIHNPCHPSVFRSRCCDWSVKDNDNESNSQLHKLPIA